MGEIIGNTYEIIEKIGSGGAGVVYLATHLRLGKKVVLKADKRKPATKPEVLRKEVDVLKNLSHSYIPQVYDYFVENDTVYTVIDFIEGESLDKPLKRGETFSQPQVITWAKQILEALDYLHSPVHGDPPKGYIHSDIKPANIMKKPNGDICLIDFNIALALGEVSFRAYSIGYASPEHYGIDYSTSGSLSADSFESLTDEDKTVDADKGTETVEQTRTLAASDDSDDQKTLPIKGRQNAPAGDAPRVRKVMPDVRSDIYMLGATLYHLLSGSKPDRDARKVIPLSEKQFSVTLVRIITKAMNPNPDLRYQTAKEMLDDLENIRSIDPRAKKRKKVRRIVIPALLSIFLIGVLTAFTGLKRKQDSEEWLKLAEYSENALSNGDKNTAINFALQAFPERRWPFNQNYAAPAQKALTDALGCYQVADTYYYDHVWELPSEPTELKVSPDGKIAACITSAELYLYDAGDQKLIAKLPACKSALSEIEFLDESNVVYAGDKGISVYDIENQRTVWEGEPATAIAVSGDRKIVVGIYRDQTEGKVYETENGRLIGTLDFHGRSQDVVPNDIFLNPNNNLLAVNDVGTWAAVSFHDGSLEIFNINNPDENIEIFDDQSGYTHFEGGFYKQYFAFSASNRDNSVFAVIDVEELSQIGAFPVSADAYGVEVNEYGICVQSGNVVVRLHLEDASQQPLITNNEKMHRYENKGDLTVISTEGSLKIYNEKAEEAGILPVESTADYIGLSENMIVVGSMNSPIVHIIRHKDHSNLEFAAYEPSYRHSEIRVTENKSMIDLFSFKQFRVCTPDGAIVADVDLEGMEGLESVEIYDQQFIRDESGSRLEVTYNDGTVLSFSAYDGQLINKQTTDTVRHELSETFLTDAYRIESPLHGIPEVYDRKTGKYITTLKNEDYLTYAFQSGKYIVTQYITAQGYQYGELLNSNCEVIAELPYLCDELDGILYFDCPNGSVRSVKIYELEELISLANNNQEGW